MIFPLIPAVLLLLLPGERTRNFITRISFTVITAASLYVAWLHTSSSPLYLTLDSGFAHEGVFAAETLIAAFILFLGMKEKRYLASALVTLQFVLMILFEFGPVSGAQVAHEFFIDQLSIIMALIIGIIGSLICVYALGYMRDFHSHRQDVKDRRPFFFFVVFIFLSAMFGLVFSNSLTWLFFFWEVTTLCSFLLIGYTGTPEAANNAWRALTMNLAGGVAFAGAIVYLAFSGGPLELDRVISSAHGAVMIPVALLCLAGMTKSAQMPFSSWLLGAMVAPTNSAVLIYGETGVGKELVARAIHRECSRKEGPFIRVNCAALSDSLIDSELFGHERGAFTGAIKTKAGRFELANQGTIFLDEISELPLPTQSKLLRVIQEKEFQRVGGTKILHSDFRLITATNKDLQQEVSANRFREDLFYRLNVFPIFVPPLRERKEDIPNLAMHFLNLFCSQNKKQIMGIPESEMVKLQNYSWPGNIRELSNMIERAVISGSPIRFPELEDAKPIVPDQAKVRKLDNIVKNVERQSILDALEKTRGKVSGKDGAAALLGMNRSALIHRMRKLGIQIVRNPKNTD